MAWHRFCLIVLLMTFLSPSVKAEWGVGASLGLWESDGHDLHKELENTLGDISLAPTSGEVTTSLINGQFDVFYEKNLWGSLGLGVSLGITSLPPSKLNQKITALTPQDVSMTIKNTSISIPFAVYLRDSLPELSTTFIGGLGGELIMAKTDFQIGGLLNLSGEFKDEKIVPFLVLGGRYYVTPSFSLGVDVKYLFSAVLDDFSGNASGSGIPSREYRLIMQEQPPLGETIGVSSVGITPGTRPYEIDFGGARVNFVVRYHFGR